MQSPITSDAYNGDDSSQAVSMTTWYDSQNSELEVVVPRTFLDRAIRLLRDVGLCTVKCALGGRSRQWP